MSARQHEQERSRGGPVGQNQQVELPSVFQQHCQHLLDLSEGKHLCQNVAYMDRLDYVSALHMEHLLAAAVETLLGVGVPQRAGHLRVAFMELARVAQLPCHGQ